MQISLKTGILNGKRLRFTLVVVKPGLARDLVSSRLAVLKSLGVLETRMNERNVLHWFVSPQGKQMLGDVLSGQEEH